MQNNTLYPSVNLSPAQIFDVEYDHNGPSGCVRKIVTTSRGPFLYVKVNGQWAETNA